MKTSEDKKSRRERRRVKGTNTGPTRPVPSRNAVLAIPELIEMILQFLDQRTLLLGQRVCRSWHSIIASSDQLQRLLWLQPKYSSITGARQLQAPNPLLYKPFYSVLNMTQDMVMARRIGMFDFIRGQLSIADMKNGRRRHLAFIRPEASWRRMLVAHPAPRRIGYLRIHQDTRVSEWQHIDVPEGLRMGQLYDMVYAAVWGDATPARGRHTVALHWVPERGRKPGFPIAWEGQVDLVVCEEVWAPDQDRRGAEFPLPRDRCLDSAWMFRSQAFEDPGLQLAPLGRVPMTIGSAYY